MLDALRRRLLRLLVAVAIVAGVLSGVAPAQATYVPATLAHRLPVQPGAVEPGFPIDYLGVLWEDDGPHADEEGLVGAARSRPVPARRAVGSLAAADRGRGASGRDVVQRPRVGG